MPYSCLPFDVITGEDVTEGELSKDNKAQESISETSSLVFGFFRLSLLAITECFFIGKVSSRATI